MWQQTYKHQITEALHHALHFVSTNTLFFSALYPSSSLTQTPTTSVAAKCVSDPDLEAKVRKTVERISENVHICANEPSLAFYRYNNTCSLFLISELEYFTHIGLIF